MTHLARRMQRPYGKARSSACITQRMSSLRSASTSSINVPLVRPSINTNLLSDWTTLTRGLLQTTSTTCTPASTLRIALEENAG
jgi:hypothetical protein